MSFDFKKATQSFDNLSFQKRMTSVFHLFKNTFTVIGRDEDIIKPFYRMTIYSSLMVIFFFYFVFSFWYDLPLAGLLFFFAILLFLYKYFYYNKQEMRMSWIVNRVITGHDPSYADSVPVSKQLKSQVRKLAWIDIGMAVAQKSRSSGKQGLLGGLINLVLAGLGEVWDLVNHYLLPSVAVDKLDIKPAVEKMKKLKDQVPETLVGVFGIDFLGKVVGKVAGPVYFILILLSLGLGVLLGDILPSQEFNFNNPDFPLDGLVFSWIPLVGAIALGKLFSTIFAIMVTSVKVIYFTVFYTKITHPDSITEDLQEELNSYLKLEEVDEVKNLEEQDTVSDQG
jgi:Ca2+/Na+ antiporter